jgi:hypothetical protein
MATEAAARERRPVEPSRAARRPFAALGSFPIAALGVALGAFLGFGFAELATADGARSEPTIGFGFLPADGWNVVQAGTAGATGTAHAVAANVPLRAGDGSTSLPYETLRTLPPSGAVIVARLVTGDKVAGDSDVNQRRLPLQLGEATPSVLPAGLADAGLVALRLRADVSGHDLDATVFLGAPPSPESLAAVDGQLRRLVVAPSAVSLVVQPTLIRRSDERMTIYGSVSSGKAGEKVTVQFKACGLQPEMFRDALETTTQAGGGFSFVGQRPFNLGVSGVFRAVSSGDASPEVRVQQRAAVYMQPQRGPNRGRFRVRVWGKVSFWRRYVLIQRFERRRGVWVTMRRVSLTEENGSATPLFRPAVPKGTLIRAVFPLSQARPCYLAGYGPLLRT